MGIVPDVRVGHEKIMRADHGLPVGFGRAVNGDVLAENVVVADAQARRLVPVFQILRRVADDTARVKRIVRADGRQAREINVRPDDAVRAQLHAFVNHGIRPDANG